MVTPAACAVRRGCGRRNNAERPALSGLSYLLFYGKHPVEFAVAQSVDFLHLDLHRNPFFHRFYMTNHANGFSAGVERIQRIKGGIQRFTVERAEAFIKEQRVNARFVADQIGERQR